MIPLRGLVYTADESLLQRIRGAAEDRVAVRQVARLAEAQRFLESMGEAIVWVDLCADGAQAFLAHLVHAHPTCPAIVVGEPRSDPARESLLIGVFAVEPRDFDLLAMQQTLRHAMDRVLLYRENVRLRATVAEKPTVSVPAVERAGDGPLRHFIRTLRHFDNVDALLSDAVKSVALALGVSRVGIFVPDESGVYRLKAELRCLPETHELIYPDYDPFVRWLERHAQMIVRATVDRIEETHVRPLLKMALDAMGAEMIAPLQSRGRLIGWVFIGRRVIGRPFDEDDLHDIAAMSDHISLAMENARLFQDLASQTALAATVFETMSTGIVVSDAEGRVRWVNRAAGEILGVDPSQAMGREAAALGNRIYDCLQTALEGEAAPTPVEWVETLTRRAVSVLARRLDPSEGRGGAVVFIEDVTTQRKLREKETQLERATIWKDLAASLSHEIRNPLTAIKTFVQLLPEQYGNPEFRERFSSLVVQEVGRLETILEQINRFAFPAAPVFKRVSPRAVFEAAIERSTQRTPRGAVTVDIVGRDAPDVVADFERLTEAVACLIDNAVEALANRPHPRVELEAIRCVGPDGAPEVALTIRDNGPGIPEPIRDKVLSPFVTTKTRGMGLGLPIARRTAEEHGGRIRVESGASGTAVALYVPQWEDPTS